MPRLAPPDAPVGRRPRVSRRRGRAIASSSRSRRPGTARQHARSSGRSARVRCPHVLGLSRLRLRAAPASVVRGLRATRAARRGFDVILAFHETPSLTQERYEQAVGRLTGRKRIESPSDSLRRSLGSRSGTGAERFLRVRRLRVGRGGGALSMGDRDDPAGSGDQGTTAVLSGAHRDVHRHAVIAASTSPRLPEPASIPLPAHPTTQRARVGPDGLRPCLAEARVARTHHHAPAPRVARGSARAIGPRPVVRPEGVEGVRAPGAHAASTDSTACG